MNNDDVTPVELSFGFEGVPDRPMRVVPRMFGNLAYSDPRWKYVNTAVSGRGWHVIKRNRQSNQVVTLCGLGGRKVDKSAPVFEPCPDCLAAASA